MAREAVVDYSTKDLINGLPLLNDLTLILRGKHQKWDTSTQHPVQQSSVPPTNGCCQVFQVLNQQFLFHLHCCLTVAP